MQGGLLLGDPVFYALACALLEGYAEGAVAAVTAAGGQMLGLDRLALGGGTPPQPCRGRRGEEPLNNTPSAWSVRREYCMGYR